jgi:2-polyprenyl-6-hydroxyphenyl methylase/3-demethylubiquinone-9 3-methyltransferase
VKPGGWVFFSTINRNAKAFALAIVGAEYMLNLIARGTHEYAKFIRPSELIRWSRQAELDLKDSAGVHYNPLTDRFTLSADSTVNYMIATQRSNAPP